MKNHERNMMRHLKNDFPEDGTPISLPDMNRIWKVWMPVGFVLLLVALFLWRQQGIDEAVLFHYNPARLAGDPLVILSKWLTSYGMAFITAILILYLVVSQWNKSLDAPLTIYLYTISSFAMSGIAGDLLKQVFARPRPAAAFGDAIFALSQATSQAFPSGHATKSVALAIPFIFLVSNSKNIHKAIKALIALVAVGVCFSRIVLAAHYVSDVVAGIGVALIGLPLTMLFANMILKRMKVEQLPAASKKWGIILVGLTIIFVFIF